MRVLAILASLRNSGRGGDVDFVLLRATVHLIFQGVESELGGGNMGEDGVPVLDFGLFDGLGGTDFILGAHDGVGRHFTEVASEHGVADAIFQAFDDGGFAGGRGWGNGVECRSWRDLRLDDGDLDKLRGSFGLHVCGDSDSRVLIFGEFVPECRERDYGLARFSGWLPGLRLFSLCFRGRAPRAAPCIG